ncbi:hypothetical protein WN51_09389, partial [Melipona quadrifasciata]
LLISRITINVNVLGNAVASQCQSISGKCCLVYMSVRVFEVAFRLYRYNLALDVAFLELALRLRNAQILPLNSWKAVPAPGSPDAVTRAVIYQLGNAWMKDGITWTMEFRRNDAWVLSNGNDKTVQQLIILHISNKESTFSTIFPAIENTNACSELADNIAENTTLDQYIQLQTQHGYKKAANVHPNNMKRYEISTISQLCIRMSQNNSFCLGAFNCDV